MMQNLIVEESKIGSIDRLPPERIAELTQKHRKTYKQAFKIDILISATKGHAINSILNIVTISTNVQNCLELMSDLVDKFAAEQIKQDNFFQGIPVGEINRLKRELKPLFR